MVIGFSNIGLHIHMYKISGWLTESKFKVEMVIYGHTGTRNRDYSDIESKESIFYVYLLRNTPTTHLVCCVGIIHEKQF